MPAKLAESDQMTVEEFLAFYQSRPDGERWELIEGEAVMSPSPTEWHQVICGNILAWLLNYKAERDALWIPMIGVGTKVPVSPKSLPQPDLFVKEGAATDSHVTDDALVVFEVLSKSNGKSDQAWRKRVYSSIPNCQHYVAIETDFAEITRYDRADSWRGTTCSGLDQTLSLPAITVTIPLRTIYRWTEIS